MAKSFPTGRSGGHAVVCPFDAACGSSVEGGQLAPSGELAAGDFNMNDPVETDEDDAYYKMLTLIGRSEELDQRVAVHEVCHYLMDRLNGSDRIVQVSITPSDTWEGICYGERRQAFANGGRDASDVRELLQPVMPAPGESHSATSDVVQSVFDACAELLAGEVGERLVLGSADPARDDRRQARELASLICKSEAGVNRFIAFCEQQAADMLAPYAMVIMSLQVILRMRRDMSGEELDQALASALGSFQLYAEHARRAQWTRAVESAARFSASVELPCVRPD
jgi:hypothetical protein